MAKIKTGNLGLSGKTGNPRGIAFTKPPTNNFKGAYLPVNAKPEFPFPDLSMPGVTVNLSAAQAAAFLLLNDNIKFSDNFPIVAAEADTPDGYSVLGTPIYGRIILGVDGQSNDYTDAQGNAGSYQTVELDCALVDVEFNNKVVVTNIQGLGSSVKEFIAGGDDDITIKGIYNSTPGVAPIDFIGNLRAIFKAPVPIPVTNYYLNLLNIFCIVIMPGTAMGQEQGAYASQTFTIKAVSDIPMTEMLP